MKERRVQIQNNFIRNIVYCRHFGKFNSQKEYFFPKSSEMQLRDVHATVNCRHLGYNVTVPKADSTSVFSANQGDSQLRRT